MQKKRGLNISHMAKVVDTLQQGLPLDEKYRDHELKGKYKGFRECHVQSDWLLIYLFENDILTLTWLIPEHMRICLLCNKNRLLAVQ